MAITFLSAAAAGTSSITGQCTVPIAIGSGDTVIVAVKSDPSAFVLGPIDTGGTSYTPLGNFSAGSISLALYASPQGGAVASSSVSCSISPAFTDLVMVVARYSGASSFGTAGIGGGITANPNILLSTTAANSVMVAAFAGSAAQADTALTGNLRQAFFLSGNTQDTLSLVDNTSGSPASLTAAVTNVANSWVALSVEMFAASAAAPVLEDDSWKPPSPYASDPNITVW